MPDRHPHIFRPSIEHEQDQLFQRADKAIAESERLKDELSGSMRKAQQLDDHLHDLQRRMEDASQRTQLTASAPHSGPHGFRARTNAQFGVGLPTIHRG